MEKDNEKKTKMKQSSFGDNYRKFKNNKNAGWIKKLKMNSIKSYEELIITEEMVKN